MPIQITRHTEQFSSSGQIAIEDLTLIAEAGFHTIICNRPDDEDGGQHVASAELAKQAAALGLQFAYLPVGRTGIAPQEGVAMHALLAELPAPVLAFCRSGTRSTNLFRLVGESTATGRPDMQPNTRPQAGSAADANSFDVVVVGGGSAGIAVVASLLQRQPALRIAIVEPSEQHYYQPAWTLVGAGEFDIRKTVRPTASVIPSGAQWIQRAVAFFAPDERRVGLAGGRVLVYQQLIVCAGLQLAWDKIEGLEETLGKHGVTSNYRYDLAPYTWELVAGLKRGKAIFTQPGMPIKCAGAPQKAVYLSCDHWARNGVDGNIEVEFCNAGGVLFGVATFVPVLMSYMKKYRVKLSFNANLVKVDGPRKLAWFDVKDEAGNVSRVEKNFDMLHVVPPQLAPDVVRRSPLADAAGWCEVDHATLQHPRFPDVFALGDVCSAPNAKTVAAVRKQVVVVAENLLALRSGQALPTKYDGYGACPLTVEKGKIVLAEFGYGGKLLPTFPLAPTVPRRSAWYLKAAILPAVYWHLVLKGREWLARPSVK